MKQTFRSLLLVATLTLTASPAFTQGPTGGDPPPPGNGGPGVVITGSGSGGGSTTGSTGGTSQKRDSHPYKTPKTLSTTATVITILWGYLGV
jgi:hypothetical protein